jgi:hypothetical protein
VARLPPLRLPPESVPHAAAAAQPPTATGRLKGEGAKLPQFWIYPVYEKFCLKVPSGQIGSARKWYHWIALEKDINRYMFLIFNF